MFWRTDINKSLRVEDQNIQVRFKSGVGITPSNANSCKGRPMINDNADFVNISIVINHNCRTYGFWKCLKMYLSYYSLVSNYLLHWEWIIFQMKRLLPFIFRHLTTANTKKLWHDNFWEKKSIRKLKIKNDNNKKKYERFAWYKTASLKCRLIFICVVVKEQHI